MNISSISVDFEDDEHDETYFPSAYFHCDNMPVFEDEENNVVDLSAAVFNFEQNQEDENITRIISNKSEYKVTEHNIDEATYLVYDSCLRELAHLTVSRMCHCGETLQMESTKSGTAIILKWVTYYCTCSE